MKKFNCLKYLILLVFSIIALNAKAVKVEIPNSDGLSIWYNVHEGMGTAAITYKGDSHYQYTGEYYGDLNIPATIEYEGETYNVETIDSYAMSRCPGITSVTIPETMKTISNYAFANCTGISNVYIPSSVTDLGVAFYGCTGLVSIDVSEDNPNYISENGIVFNKQKTKIIQFPANYTETSYVIPSEVTVIGNGAFYSCLKLEEVEIHENIKQIEKEAFAECTGLKRLYLKPEEPPTLNESNTFTNINSDIYTYVPNGTTQKYRRDQKWDYLPNFTEIDFSWQHNVEVSSNDDNLGVAIATKTGKLYNYEYITVTAIPKEGTRFVNWTRNGNVCTTDSIYTDRVMYNSDFVANFEKLSLSGTKDAVKSKINAIVAGDVIKLYGTEEGEQISLYSANGMIITNAVAEDGVTTIATSATGVVIIKVADEIVRVVK